MHVSTMYLMSHTPDYELDNDSGESEFCEKHGVEHSGICILCFGAGVERMTALFSEMPQVMARAEQDFQRLLDTAHERTVSMARAVPAMPPSEALGASAGTGNRNL